MMNPFLYLRIRRLFNDSTHEVVFRGKWIMSRDYIIGMLKEIGLPAVEVVSGMLKSRSSARRLHAIKVLEKFGSPLAVSPLIEALDSRDWELRHAAACSLGALGHFLSARPLLLTIINEEDIQVRNSAILALGKTPPAAPEDLRLLHKAMRKLGKPETNGELSRGEAGSLRKTYENWAMQLRELAAEKHKSMGLQIPPKLRKPPAHMRRREEIGRRMVAGRRA
jgi:hypothetical protein